MKTMIAYHSKTDLNGILDMVKEYTTERVTKNLRVFAKQNKIELELPHADLELGQWDGTLLIHFLQPMSAADVINYIVNDTRADEMNFVDEKTLRLWWD